MCDRESFPGEIPYQDRKQSSYDEKEQDMENGIIEEVQVDVGGLPFLDFVAAEIKISGTDDASAYYGFVEVDSTLVFFESEHSLYAAMLNNDDLERFQTGMYSDYDAFYAELEMEKPLSVRSRVRKALICLVRAPREETEYLKQEMVGKAIGTLALPDSDM